MFECAFAVGHMATGADVIPCTLLPLPAYFMLWGQRALTKEDHLDAGFADKSILNGTEPFLRDIAGGGRV